MYITIIYDGQSRAFYWTWKEWWPSEPSFRTIDFAYIAALDEMKSPTKRDRKIERKREREGVGKEKKRETVARAKFVTLLFLHFMRYTVLDIKTYFTICRGRVIFLAGRAILLISEITFGNSRDECIAQN